MSKINDCPFCGSEDVEHESICSNWHNISCNKCGATGPGKSGKKKSIEAWNDRVNKGGYQWP